MKPGWPDHKEVLQGVLFHWDLRDISAFEPGAPCVVCLAFLFDSSGNSLYTRGNCSRQEGCYVHVMEKLRLHSSAVATVDVAGALDVQVDAHHVHVDVADGTYVSLWCGGYT